MRKFVFFLTSEPVQDFRPSDLSGISRLPADGQLVRYIDERIIDASLHKLADYGPLKQLELTCKYKGRRPTGKVSVRPTIKQKSDVWIHKGKRFALAVDLPLELSPIVAALLSDGLYERLGAVRNLNMGRKEFERLRKGVEQLGGRLVSFHLLDVGEPAPLETLQASGRRIEVFPGFKRAFETSRVKRLGFHVNLGDDRFSFWIANLGNGTLYLPPVPEPHHIRRFTEFVEEALGDVW